MLKKGAKVWCFIVILTVVGLMFSGLLITTSATSEKTTINVLDSPPWFTKECYSKEKLWWWLHQYEETHDYYISTYVGGMSRLGGSPSEPNCWAKFKPYLSQSGKYEVYAYFYAWKYTSTKVPFTVKYDGGSTTIKVNQSRSSPAWKEESLGTWYFKAGQDSYVEVTDATGERYNETKGLTIGAIKFMKKETVPTPVITGIDPSQPTASPAKQWITIKGTGFVSDSTVTLRIGSSTYPLPADRTEFKSSTQIRVKAGLTDPGTWSAQVTNPGNRISNLFSFTVKQEIPSPVHDMAVTNVYTTPSSPNVGQSTTIHVTVKNEGRQQENYVPVKAYVDGYQVGSAQYVTLLDGKSTTKSFTWTPSSAKTYSVKGEVGVVSGETETSDNEKTISVSVQQQNQPPNTPTMLFQLKSDSITLIPVGSETTENSVTFKGVVSDPDGDQVKLQVELRRLDEYGGQFDETQGGFKESGFLESGSEAVAYVNDLIDADYHWRARAVDEHGNEGEWENFGNNDILDADFIVSSQNQPPVALFSYSPEKPKAGEWVTFDASDSYDPDGKIELYGWDLNNDGIYEECTPWPKIKCHWNKAGTYQVGLKVIENNGASRMLTKAITVKTSFWDKVGDFFKDIWPWGEKVKKIEDSDLSIIEEKLGIDKWLPTTRFYWCTDHDLKVVLKSGNRS